MINSDYMRQKPFIYPGNIDMSRALAVSCLVKGEEEDKCWQVIQDWITEVGTEEVFRSIIDILDKNPFTQEEQLRILKQWNVTTQLRATSS